MGGRGRGISAGAKSEGPWMENKLKLKGLGARLKR
jgi:hypothetical protein